MRETVSVPNQTSSIENAAAVAKIKTELEYFKVFGFSEDQIALDAGSVDEDVAAVHLREGDLGQVLENFFGQILSKPNATQLNSKQL